MGMTPELDPAQPDHGDVNAEVVYGVEATQRAKDPAVLGIALGLTELRNHSASTIPTWSKPSRNRRSGSMIYRLNWTS